MPNYLQAMAGRLGRGMGIDPRRRMAQQLMAQGMDTSPAHLGTGIGRLGKALAAAYMMRQSQGQEADAMEWLTAKDPGRTPRQPTEAEAYATDPDLLKLHFASAAATSPTLPGGLVERLKTGGEQQEPLGLDPLSGPQADQGTTRERTLSQWSPAITADVVERVMQRTRGTLSPNYKFRSAINETDIERQGREIYEGFPEEFKKNPTDAELDRLLAGPGEPVPEQFAPTGLPSGVAPIGDDQIQEETFTKEAPRDYAQELASGMTAYQGAKANQISDPRTRMEWLRESYRNNPELQNNWFANRLIQNMMVNEMERDISQEDIKSKRGFTTSERLAKQKFESGEKALDRTSRERAAKLRAVGEDPNKWKTWLNADKLSPEKFEKFLLTIRGYSPKDIGGTLHTPMLSKPDQGVGEDTKITLGPEQEPEYIQKVEDIKQEAKLDAKYMDDLKRMQPKASGLLDSFKQKTAFMKDNIEQAIANISGWSTAYGAMLQGWPRTQAQALGTLLTTIKANVGFQALQEMRANSPTGGALGQVSERELAYLQATLGDIAQTQDGAILAQKLKAMQGQIEGMSERLQQAYDMTFAPLTGAQGSRSGRAGDTVGGSNVDFVWDDVKQKLVPNRRQQ